MHKIPRLFLIFLLLSLPLAGWANAPRTALDFLKAMSNAHQTATYEILYNLQQGNESESFRYRHTTANGKGFAQLLRLDNRREEQVLKGNTVSYLGYGFRPFSLPSSQILDNLPAIFNADLTQLNGYYVEELERDRIADRVARGFKLIPKNNDRYPIVLWIDENNHILLKSELFDQSGRLLEQFKVVQLSTDNQIHGIVEAINTLILPEIIAPAQNQTADPEWQLGWLPEGFKPINRIQKNLLPELTELQAVDSQLYSDGIFSFNLYVIPNVDLLASGQFWQQDKTLIYSEIINNNNVILVGDLPLETAKRIAQSVQFVGNAQ
ncbi:hypothetical protein B0187_09250 [Haemophilus paracuniculus]|uniref:Sigma-E factor regulatory protein RseB n=1 Tax=Haemophilus paracuniculus TaxID=734 RepID=A0A1T0APT1_9PAST|nr:MucB/RseB C-terminal domain-containing protein [Haemophilus paracuniculus]OOR98123.1 hypothetical protein B0187_09250 [Haemophilus paracuniculus]